MSMCPLNTTLAEVLFSKNRRAVLSLLYGHPDQTFYLRQIVRVSGGGHGAIQRELKILSDVGILRRTVRDKQVYFQAHPDCPVFEELKSLIIKTAGVADVLKAALTVLGERVQAAFIFGSVARGQQKELSDVDLLVVGTTTFRNLVAALADAQTTLRREINPTLYTPEEFRTKLASRNHFLRAVLASNKLFLIGDERELERLASERSETSATTSGQEVSQPGRPRRCVSWRTRACKKYCVSLEKWVEFPNWLRFLQEMLTWMRCYGVRRRSWRRKSPFPSRPNRSWATSCE